LKPLFYWQAIVQQIMSFSNVATFDASTILPSISFLQQFDAALVWGSVSTVSGIPSGIGDVLAQYWDLGGSVVLTVDALCNNKLTGRFASISDGYILLDGFAKTNPSDDRLGVIYEQDSFLVLGLGTFSASPAPKCMGAVVNGGVTVAAWKSGAPLIVRGVRTGRPLVALNIYPVPGTTGSGWTGDGANLIRNAVVHSVCAPCGAKYSSVGEPQRP
jgi:hypothetical protein